MKLGVDVKGDVVIDVDVDVDVDVEGRGWDQGWSAEEWRFETGCAGPRCQLSPWPGTLTPTDERPSPAQPACLGADQ